MNGPLKWRSVSSRSVGGDQTIAVLRKIVFLSCALCWAPVGPLEAYTVTVTPLTDKTFPPVDAKQVVFSGDWEKHASVTGEEDLATITLRFEPQEIGSDNSAAITLGRREAAKLGATSYYSVSGTERDATKDIATRTFHLTRSKETISASPPGEPAPESYYRDIRATSFGKIYFEWIDARKNMTPDEKVIFLRVREKKARRGDVVVSRYFDVKTDKGLTEDEVQRRFILYIAHERPVFIAKNADLYRSDFPALQKINGAYTAQNSSFIVIDWPLPPAEPPAVKTDPELPRVM